MHLPIESRFITLAASGAFVAGRRSSDAPSLEALLQASIEVALESTTAPVVLAVSGGRDSMSLLHAMARWAPDCIAAVATFDHGTGAAATEGASLAAAEARRLGLTVVRERARNLQASEAAWRTARWEFLNRVARAWKARVMTAHTRDDQLETIVMRLLRGTGVRGLAALAANTGVLRPWLPVTRLEIAQWAWGQEIAFVDDPSNENRRYLRSRVRHDLLPALESAHPGFAEEMLSVGERALDWRTRVERLVDDMAPETLPDGRLRIDATRLRNESAEAQSILWPALFGRIGVALDATGTRELVRFSKTQRHGAKVTLSGEASALLIRAGVTSVFELRPPTWRTIVAPFPSWTGAAAMLPRRVGRWRFVPLSAEVANDSRECANSLWMAGLAADRVVTIRGWTAGDRIAGNNPEGAGRRVARYFVEAAVAAPDRRAWPVVLSGTDVVWVPGVCRSSAAPSRPGRSDLIWYRCEREHG